MARTFLTFGKKEHVLLSACLTKVLSSLASGASLDAATTVCQRNLDTGDPESVLSQVRGRTVNAVLTKCAGVAPEDIGSPCDPAASSMADVVQCVLGEQAEKVEEVIAAEYRHACSLLGAVGLAAAFPGVCPGP